MNELVEIYVMMWYW